MQAPLQARNDADAAPTGTVLTVAQGRLLADNRPGAVAQGKFAGIVNSSPRVLQRLTEGTAVDSSARMAAQRDGVNALAARTAHQADPTAGRAAGLQTGATCQRVAVKNAPVVDAQATVPALGNAFEQTISQQPFNWTNGAAPVNARAAILGVMVAENAIATIVAALQRTPAQTGAQQPDLTIAYDANLGGYGVLETNFHANHQWQELAIKIAPLAFDSKPRLYSTIRHELIHAAQARRTDAKENNWAADPAQASGADDIAFDLSTYQPYAAPANAAQQRRNDFFQDMNLALSEIETHKWEYENAANIGLPARDRYERGLFWLRYKDAWLGLLANVQGAHKKSPAPGGGNLSDAIFKEYRVAAARILPTAQDDTAIEQVANQIPLNAQQKNLMKANVDAHVTQMPWNY